MKRKLTKLAVKKVSLLDLDAPAMDGIAGGTALMCLTNGQATACEGTKLCTAPSDCYYTCVNPKCV